MRNDQSTFTEEHGYKIDVFDEWEDLRHSDSQYLDEYTELKMRQNDGLPIDQNRLNELEPRFKHKIPTAAKLNKYQNGLVGMQTFIKTEVEGFVLDKQEEIKSYTNVKKQEVLDYTDLKKSEVETTVVNGQNAINTTKDNALISIERKKENIIDYMDSTTAGAIRNDIGVMGDLTTVNKSSLVNAINEVNAKEVDLTPINDKIDILSGVGESQEKLNKIEFDKYKADLASQEVGKGASLIGIHDADTLFTATNVEGALKELFTNVSDGKNKIATTITDKGIKTSGSDTFDKMANNIKSIKTGYSVGDLIQAGKYENPPILVKTYSCPDYVDKVTTDKEGNVYCASGTTVRKLNSNLTFLWNYTGHTRKVNDICVDNQGNIYSCSEDMTVRKISPKGELIWSFTKHTDYVNAVAVDNEGNVYSGGNDRVLRKISPDGEQLNTYLHRDTIYSIAIDNEGNAYIGGGGMYTTNDFSIVKVKDGKSIWVDTFHTSRISGIAVSNGLGEVYSCSPSSNIMRVRNLDGSSPKGINLGSYASPRGISVTDEGSFYLADSSYTVKWDYTSNKEIWRYSHSNNAVSTVCINNEGNVYSGGNDRRLSRLFDGIKIIK